MYREVRRMEVFMKLPLVSNGLNVSTFESQAWLRLLGASLLPPHNNLLGFVETHYLHFFTSFFTSLLQPPLRDSRLTVSSHVISSGLLLKTP